MVRCRQVLHIFQRSGTKTLSWLFDSHGNPRTCKWVTMVKKKHHNLFITIVGVQNNFGVSHPIRVKCKMYSYIAKSHINRCTRKKQRRGLNKYNVLRERWRSSITGNLFKAKEDHQLNLIQTSDTVLYNMYQHDNVLKISHISVWHADGAHLTINFRADIKPRSYPSYTCACRQDVFNP